ncbi:MAG: hypothetical protein ABII64_00620 [Elusimicrobiota bacterium]
MGSIKPVLLILFCAIILSCCKAKKELLPDQPSNQEILNQQEQKKPAKKLKITDVEMPPGYTLIESSAPYVEVLTPYATYPVMLLETKEEKLFEIVNGTEPGKFMLDSFMTGEGTGSGYGRHYAVNSKGEIYFLDPMNNRIQKFSKDGKYIKSIAVPARARKNGESAVKYRKKGIRDEQSGAPDAWCILDGADYYPDNETEYYYYLNKDIYYFGADIAIDGQDNLYFLLVKNVTFPRFMEPQGEYDVWRFTDDELTNKYPVILKSKQLYTPELLLENGNVNMAAEGGKYDFINEKIFNVKSHQDTVNKLNYEVRLVGKNMKMMSLKTINGYNTTITFPEIIDTYNILGRAYLFDNKGYRIFCTDRFVGDDYYDLDVLEYALDGKLTGTHNVVIVRRLGGNNPGGKIGQDGHVYSIFPHPLFRRILFIPFGKDE